MRVGFGERREAALRYRIILLAGIACIAVIVYLIILFNLQVVRGTEFMQKAVEVTQRSSVIPAQRGEIYDRNFDVPLAINIPSFAVSIVPAEINDNERRVVLPRLADVLDMPVKEIETKLPVEYDHLYQPVEIANGIDLKKISYIAEHIQDFPGVSWNNKSIRSYTIPGSLSHIIGYVGDITREELQVLYNQGYSNYSTLGKNGVEKVYDNLLRGTDGIRYSTVDVRGRKILQPTVQGTGPAFRQ